MDKKRKDNTKGFSTSKGKNIQFVEIEKASEAHLGHFLKEINPLALVTGVAFVGMSVMLLVMSIFGLIRFFWLAAVMSMFASVSTMLGMFYLYDLINQRKTRRNLAREAINRAVQFRN